MADGVLGCLFLDVLFLGFLYFWLERDDGV